MERFTPEELAACVRVLETLAEDRTLLVGVDEATRHALLEAAGRVSRPARAERKKLNRAFRRRDRALDRAHDARIVDAAVNRRARRASSEIVLPASTAHERALPPAENLPGPEEELINPRDCYICKAPFKRVHHFYDSLCPPCAELNYAKRLQTAPLDGRIALITGARIKIGYQAALMMLRAGAQVIATTRFPRDAALRFAREPDFEKWNARLTVHGIDLRHIPTVEKFADHLAATLPRLDVLVNNAAQTVRRPAAFYEHLRETEARLLDELPDSARPLLRAHEELRLLPAPDSSTAIARAEDPAFPRGRFDLDEQQLDLRTENSWRLTLAEVPTVELVEVHLVNAVAPFVLTARLKPLMMRARTDDKHVINVSAMEAQFARNKKTDKHPHTNMAKAALNMMTRTSAADYAGCGIFMNSVDTGWITDEDPLVHVARKQRVHDFHPPLDAIDGAARVLDPLFSGLNSGRHAYGIFFKDYRSVAW